MVLTADFYFLYPPFYNFSHSTLWRYFSIAVRQEVNNLDSSVIAQELELAVIFFVEE